MNVWLSSRLFWLSFFCWCTTCLLLAFMWESNCVIYCLGNLRPQVSIRDSLKCGRFSSVVGLRNAVLMCGLSTRSFCKISLRVKWRKEMLPNIFFIKYFTWLGWNNWKLSFQDLLSSEIQWKRFWQYFSVFLYQSIYLCCLWNIREKWSCIRSLWCHASFMFT